MSKPKLETRYRALTKIEHPMRFYRDSAGHIRNVYVMEGEDVDLSHRQPDRIQDLITGSVVEPYSVPKGTPHVVHKQPVKEVFSQEKNAMVEVREWNEARYQWGKYDADKRTMRYFSDDYNEWLGETEFIEEYVSLGETSDV